MEAERKLEATEQNLVRVNDVLAEIRRQISLDRAPGQEGRALQAPARDRSACSSSRSRPRSARELAAELEAARRRALTALRDAAAAAEARLAEREAALEGRRLELAERERLVVEGNELALPAAQRASRSSRARSATSGASARRWPR